MRAWHTLSLYTTVCRSEFPPTISSLDYVRYRTAFFRHFQHQRAAQLNILLTTALSSVGKQMFLPPPNAGLLFKFLFQRR